MPCFVYILRSLKDGTYYYGCSADLPKRIKEHNAGKATYTRAHRPFELHYVEEFAEKRDALLRERFFKSIAGYNWLRLQGIIQR